MGINMENTNKYFESVFRKIVKSKELYLIILLPFLYIILFNYYPMYGAQIAFRDFDTAKGILGSSWVGFKYFVQFFQTHNFWILMSNTLEISIYTLVLGFPIPIILAIAVHNCSSKRFKKTVQMFTYAPHFISVVVMVGIIIQLTSLNHGVINNIISALGFERKMFMGDPNLFSSIYVWSGIWQSAGWGSIIYIAALTNVPVELHESAVIDGASLIKRILNIDIPSILPMIIITLIMSCGNLINIGFEKALLMQNSMNIESSEIISTYAYKVAFNSSLPQYSFGTAIGIFNSIVNLFLIITVNYIFKKKVNVGLW